MFRGIFFLCFVWLFISCSEKAVLRRQVRNTINASGFTKDTLTMFRSTQSELAVYNLSSNETVADIGFGTAWLVGVILVKYDSIKFYASDIDEAALQAIQPITKKYLSLRESPNTNTLTVVKGETKRTNLPPNTFDKIIVRETFHHFEFPNEMLLDIKALLKPNGKLFVYEPFVEHTFFSKDCNSNNYSRADILEYFTSCSFSLVAEHDILDSPGNTPSWYGKNHSPKKIFVFTSH